MKIILIGFMGSGKSTVAKELGHSLGLPVIEMDDLVCKKTNSANMHEVFGKGGELLLRETEIEIAREHSSSDSAIISTGAGVVLNKVILDYLERPKGTIFFLNAAFQTIKSRLAHDSSRPLFQNLAAAESLYHFRHPLYFQYAHHVIDVDHQSVQDIALEIVRRYQYKDS